MPTVTAAPTAVDVESFAWLASDEASHWLAELAQSELPLHTLAAKLRREHSSLRTHLLIEQAELRRRGAEKFTLAAKMLFTVRSLEQATDEWVSRYKAQRFLNQSRVADLCCGIGGDLIGLSDASMATGVDRCATAAYCANHNAAVHRYGTRRGIATQVADVRSIDLGEFSAWHIDPDRRPEGRRTTRVELHEPSRAVIEEMLARRPNGAIKLAPAANLGADDRWLAESEWEWISRGGQCRQLAVWHGELAQTAGQRRATKVDQAGVASFTGCPDIPVPVADRADQYLFEPDAAVLAARLVGALAGRHGLRAVSPGIAYLTGPHRIVDPLLACFEIHDHLPLDRRKLAAYLHQRNVGRVEIKHRGLKLDPDRLRSELKLRGDQEVVLIVTHSERRTVVLIAQRISRQGVT